MVCFSNQAARLGVMLRVAVKSLPRRWISPDDGSDVLVPV